MKPIHKPCARLTYARRQLIPPFHITNARRRRMREQGRKITEARAGVDDQVVAFREQVHIDKGLDAVHDRIRSLGTVVHGSPGYRRVPMMRADDVVILSLEQPFDLNVVSREKDLAREVSIKELVQCLKCGPQGGPVITVTDVDADYSSLEVVPLEPIDLFTDRGVEREGLPEQRAQDHGTARSGEGSGSDV